MTLSVQTPAVEWSCRGNMLRIGREPSIKHDQICFYNLVGSTVASYFIRYVVVYLVLPSNWGPMHRPDMVDQEDLSAARIPTVGTKCR